MYASSSTAQQIVDPVGYRPGCGAPSGGLDRLFETKGQRRSIKANATLFGQGQRVESVVQIVSGIVRCCTFSEDGHRHIFRFAGPGDLLGFVEADTWHFTAEAIGNVQFRSVPAHLFEQELAVDRAMQRQLRRIILDEFERRERQLGCVSFMQADDRVLTLLSELEDVLPTEAGFAVMPMTRQDIGDYLGMSLETVSRAFSSLKRSGKIRTDGANKFAVIDRNPVHARAA